MDHDGLGDACDMTNDTAAEKDRVPDARREIEPRRARPDLNAETKARLERIKSHWKSVTRGFTL